MIKVHVSGHLRAYTGKQRDFQIQQTGANSVFKLVQQLDEKFPGIKDRIFDDQDRTREFVNIFVNGENIRDIAGGENAPLKDDDTVHILPSVAGGSA